jgi:hypothetical protein
MGQWLEDGRYVGSTDTLDKMRTAISTARSYYKDFRSGDIVEDLTAARYGRDGKTTDIDPEAARKVILRALGDSNRSLQNMKILRDRLGADSPEWAALRQEAQEQLLGGKRADTAAFDQAVKKFERENPAMADILFSPEDRAKLTAARARVGAATEMQQGLDVGEQALTMPPADFRRATAAMSPAARRAAAAALRTELEAQAGTPGGANSLLQTLSTGTDARANIDSLLGSKAAAELFTRAEALAARSERASQVGAMAFQPEPNVQTAAAVRAGEQVSQGLPFLSYVTRFLTSRGMKPQDAIKLTQDALDPANTERVTQQVVSLLGENAGQAFMRRVLANLQEAPVVGSLPRKLGPQEAARLAVAPAGAPAAERIVETPAPEIDVENPEPGLSDDELFKQFGIEPSGPSEAPPPDEIKAASSVPQETVNFVAQLSPSDVKALTLVSEASPDPEEMRYVGHVLQNRLNRPDRYADNIYDVVLGGEFDALKTDQASLADLMQSERFKRARQIVAEVENRSEDPTNGATHFWAPELARKLGLKRPSWAKGEGIRQGQTVFYRDVD